MVFNQDFDNLKHYFLHNSSLRVQIRVSKHADQVTSAREHSLAPDSLDCNPSPSSPPLRTLRTPTSQYPTVRVRSGAYVPALFEPSNARFFGDTFTHSCSIASQLRYEYFQRQVRFITCVVMQVLVNVFCGLAHMIVSHALAWDLVRCSQVT